MRLLILASAAATAALATPALARNLRRVGRLRLNVCSDIWIPPGSLSAAVAGAANIVFCTTCAVEAKISLLASRPTGSIEVIASACNASTQFSGLGASSDRRRSQFCLYRESQSPSCRFSDRFLRHLSPPVPSSSPKSSPVCGVPTPLARVAPQYCRTASEAGETANRALRSDPGGTSVSGQADWRRETDEMSQRNCQTSRDATRGR